MKLLIVHQLQHPISCSVPPSLRVNQSLLHLSIHYDHSRPERLEKRANPINHSLLKLDDLEVSKVWTNARSRSRVVRSS